jgi:calcineurin-like phosphoesterase family protein
MSRTFVISDLHLGHRLLAELRGYEHTQDHDRAIEAAWRSTVHPDDVVYVLGDIAFGRIALERFRSFPGRKKIALGNHDRLALDAYRECAVNVRAGYEVKTPDGAGKVLLAHYPIHQSSLRPRYVLQLHGHIHDREIGPGYINCCVEVAGPFPVPLSEAIQNGLREAT